MFKKSKICTGVLLALAASVPAMAQEVLQRVEVTGSRIKTINVDSSSPVQTLTSDIVKGSMPVVVEDFVKGLPSAAPAIGGGTNNGTGGAATIDLRGLGSNRTLVLLNGRRLVPYDLSGSVNTDSIPLSLLDSVDLVTGGASAVYGSDAISGVVNFKLKRDFKGVELESTYGTSEKGDATRTRTDLTIGAGFDDGRGNVAVSFGFTKQNPLLQGDRPWGVSNRSSTSGKAGGSYTTVPAYVDGYGQIDAANGTFLPDGAETLFNYNPLNFYQTALNRKQITALGNYRINDHFDVYSEVLFTRSVVDSQLAPSGSFFNNYSVPLGNPFLSASQRAAICAGQGLTAAQCADPNQEVVLSIGRRFVELGPRLNGFDNTQYQITTGVRGDLFGSWSYDAYASYGKADQTQTQGNWGSKSKLQQALRAVNTTTCLDPSNGCVPFNIFGAAGSITPAMLAFANLSSIKLQNVEQNVLSASASGDLGNKFKSPYSRVPIGAAIGVERREISAGNMSDASSQTLNEVLGTGAPTPDRSGKVKLTEVFGELLIPLVTDAKYARNLNLEAGYRGTEFTVVKSDSYGTFKFGANWEPVQGVKFRAMTQSATRAPAIDELFAPQITQLDNLTIDPCQQASINVADSTVPGTLSYLCKQTGVPAGRIGTVSPPSAGQANILSGGNPTVGPEKARTLTVGLTFAPAQVKNLTMSLDYWHIKMSDTISTPSIDDIIDGCYSSALNPSFAKNAFCQLIGRDSVTGSFNGEAPGVRLVQGNLGKQETSGFDLGATYAISLAKMGRLDMSLLGTVVNKYTIQPSPNSAERDCLGYYSVSCGAPNPKFKFTQTTSWSFGDYKVGYAWRHIDAVNVEPSTRKWFAPYRSIGAYDYVDLNGSWKATKNLIVRLSIRNAFDKAPPIVGGNIASTTSNSGNTFPQTYDTIGRYFSLGANLKF